MTLKSILVFLLLVVINQVVAQTTVLPLNSELQTEVESALLKSNKAYFSGQKPLIYGDVNSIINLDSLLTKPERDAQILAKLKRQGIWKKIRTEDLVIHQKNGFKITINPLFDFSKASYHEGLLAYNTRGFELKSTVKDNLSVVSGFYENQAYFSDYYNERVKAYKVVPSQGRTRVFNETGFDYAGAYGNLSYCPFKVLNIQFGHGKHFYGEGYRSLILSDFAFNHPYFKITNTFKWLRYTNLLILYQNIKRVDGTSEIYNRRYGSVTSLDVLIGKYLELGVIESIVWGRKNENSYLPDANIYNPVMFIRPLQYGWNNGETNVSMGLNASLKLPKSVLLYTQYLYDAKHRTAFQVGAKSYSFFSLPLFLQLEYNQVKPYTYSHVDGQSFAHFNEELSSPLGANYTELFFRARYTWKDIIISYQYNSVKQGMNTDSVSWGHNVFEAYPYPESFDLLQGETTDIINHTFRLAFLVNPVTNMQLYFQYRSRSFNANKESFWTMGFKTNLRNLYDDF